MAKRVECDGCGEVEKVQAGKEPRIMPVRVEISGIGAPERDYDLCLRCCNHLKEVSDPRTWPRAAEDR